MNAPGTADASTRGGYDLLVEPWLHHRSLVDDGPVSLGIRDTLVRAHELAPGASPMETPALVRLLLAVLGAAVRGPADEDAWRELWQARTLPVDRIDAYLEQHRDAFDLFHPVRPFAQCAGLAGDQARPAHVLHPTFLAGSLSVNRVTDLPAMHTIAAPDAALWLWLRGMYDVGGIKAAHGGGRAYGTSLAPLAAATAMTALGATLKDTLLLNLPPAPQIPGDTPAWERPDPGPEPAQRRPVGRLDLWTHPGRRMLLHGDRHGVTGLTLTPGDGPLDWEDQRLRDPATLWVAAEKVPWRALNERDVLTPAHITALLLSGRDDDQEQGTLAHSEVFEHVLRAAATVTDDDYRPAFMVTRTLLDPHRTVVRGIDVARLDLGTAARLRTPTHLARLRTAAHAARLLFGRIGRINALLGIRGGAAEPALYAANLAGEWDALVRDLQEANPDLPGHDPVLAFQARALAAAKAVYANRPMRQRVEAELRLEAPHRPRSSTVRGARSGTVQPQRTPETVQAKAARRGRPPKAAATAAAPTVCPIGADTDHGPCGRKVTARGMCATHNARRHKGEPDWQRPVRPYRTTP